MDNPIDNQAYQLKLSELRNQVSQELVTVSGMLKDATKLLKDYLELPTGSQETAIRKSILIAGERLNTLNRTVQILNKRIEHIINNFKSNKEEENQAVKNLSQDPPQNMKSISILKSHYLEIVSLFSKDDKTNEALMNFDCFKITPEKLSDEKSSDHTAKKTKVKKHRWSLS